VTDRARNRICVELLEDRSNPVAFADIAGSLTVRDLPFPSPTEVAVTPPALFAFLGPVLSVPDALADGRTVTVSFADGATAVGRLLDADGNRTDIVVARNLPRAGTLAGEITLAKRDDPSDRIVLGFQLAIAVEDVATASSQTVVQSTPTYASGIDTPPSGEDPRPAAPIAQAPFQAGATLAALDAATIRGARTVVPLANDSVAPLPAVRVELGYSFLRSAGPIAFDSFAGNPVPVSFDPTASVERTASRPTVHRRWESPDVHGVAVESEIAIVELKDVLERIARDDAPEAIWMMETERERDDLPTERGPYWAVAALLGLGATQYFRRRESGVPEFAQL
jgi:hypothetical protein